MKIPVELARYLLQLIIKSSNLLLSSKFGFYPNAVLMYHDCFYSAIRFFLFFLFFFVCYGRRLLARVVALSKRSMRLKLLTNLTVAGKEEHAFWVLCYGHCLFRKGFVGASFHVLSV